MNSLLLTNVAQDLAQQANSFMEAADSVLAAWSRCETLLTQNPVEGLAPLVSIETHCQDLVNILHEYDSTAIPALSHQLGDICATFLGIVESVDHQILSDSNGQLTTFNELGHRLAEIPQQVSSLHESFLHGHEHLTHDLHDFSQRTDASEQVVRHSFQQYGHHIRQDWLAPIEGQIHGFERSVAELGSLSMPEVYRSAHDEVMRDYGQFSETMLRHSDSLRQQIAQELQALGEHLQQHIQDRLQAEGRRLIDECLAELLEEAVAAVGGVGLGAEITAALAPELPELIVIYKASEAIKDAVKVFKELEHGFGLF